MPANTMRLVISNMCVDVASMFFLASFLMAKVFVLEEFEF
tara:strand:- start:350 stop:469 length:120 start_codon:yes stop_codon:yes gene_type:complete